MTSKPFLGIPNPRNVGLLAICQGFFMCVQSMAIATTPLAGYALLDVDKTLATFPLVLNHAGVMMTTMATPTLQPFALGLQGSQESSGAQIGYLYTFDQATISTTSDCCPVSTTIAFARVVFTTNHVSNGDDGPDVFSGLFNIGVDGIFNQAGGNLAGSTTFGTARVNQIPEPSTLGLLGLGSGYYGFIPIETALFADGGMAYCDGSNPGFCSGDNHAVFSTGAALRINLLGYAVFEVDYVKPFQRPAKGWYWELSLTPGF